MEDNQVTVSVDWLAEHINDDNVVVVDGSWHLPPAGRNGHEEYLAEHIPSSLFFDLDTHSDHSSNMSHMMPSAMQFGREMGAMGISNDHTIVVYDSTGLFSAGRVWWMFRQFGAPNTFVLDGGLPAWKAAGHGVEAGTVEREKTKFKAALSDELIVGIETMWETVNNLQDTLILDARPAERFDGKVPEPNPALRGGHMPGAINLPYTNLLDEDKKLRPLNELKQEFDNVGFDPSRPTICTCGSGVTACVILMGLSRIGVNDAPLYDGSWSEWGARTDTPVEPN